jgi:hypothetical protein
MSGMISARLLVIKRRCFICLSFYAAGKLDLLTRHDNADPVFHAVVRACFLTILAGAPARHGAPMLAGRWQARSERFMGR